MGTRPFQPQGPPAPHVEDERTTEEVSDLELDALPAPRERSRTRLTIWLLVIAVIVMLLAAGGLAWFASDAVSEVLNRSITG
jgi:hypothetical protein